MRLPANLLSQSIVRLLENYEPVELARLSILHPVEVRAFLEEAFSEQAEA